MLTNKISQKFGKFASCEFPSMIQKIINYSYVKLLGLDMREFLSPSSYKSLNALFTRELQTPRPIDTTPLNFISPADSYITSCGTISDGILLQIKGMEYCIDDLLTSYITQDAKEKLFNGEFMNFYLSPKDYHRYHASFDCQITKAIHVAGALLPVNIPYLKKEQNLFVKNERVILECLADGKRFYMIFVGALNVGQMVFGFESRIETNTVPNSVQCFEYPNVYVKKGEELGYFKMGSTVVILWEKDFVRLENLENNKVRFGTIIANKP